MPSVHNKMVCHCVIIEFIILIPVITNILTILPNNKKVSVLWMFFFFGPPGRTPATSNMELFVTIVNGWIPFT